MSNAGLDSFNNSILDEDYYWIDSMFRSAVIGDACRLHSKVSGKHSQGFPCPDETYLEGVPEKEKWLMAESFFYTARYKSENGEVLDAVAYAARGLTILDINDEDALTILLGFIADNEPNERTKALALVCLGDLLTQEEIDDDTCVLRGRQCWLDAAELGSKYALKRLVYFSQEAAARGLDEFYDEARSGYEESVHEWESILSLQARLAAEYDDGESYFLLGLVRTEGLLGSESWERALKDTPGEPVLSMKADELFSRAVHNGFSNRLFGSPLCLDAAAMLPAAVSDWPNAAETTLALQRFSDACVKDYLEHNGLPEIPDDIFSDGTNKAFELALGYWLLGAKDAREAIAACAKAKSSEALEFLCQYEDFCGHRPHFQEEPELKELEETDVPRQKINYDFSIFFDKTE